MSWNSFRRGHYCDRCDVNIIVRSKTGSWGFTAAPPTPHLNITWFGKPVLQGLSLMLCHKCGTESMSTILKHFKMQLPPVHCLECGKKIEMGTKAPIDQRLCTYWSEHAPLTPNLQTLTLCLTHGKALESELKGKENAQQG